MKRRLGIFCLLLFGAACEQSQAPARPMQIEAGPGSSLPRLSAGADNALWLSWVEGLGEQNYRLRFARLLDQGWSAPATVVEGSDWFVNWADFPSVVPISAKLAAAHWLTKRPGGTYAYDVAITLSTDDGKSWGSTLSPHTDRSATEHGFVSLFRAGNDLGAVWLDGRRMAASGSAPSDSKHASGEHDRHGHADGQSDDHNDDNTDGGMSLRFGLISATTGVVIDQEVDPLTCDCCQTGAAVTSDGDVVVVYRDRDENEIRDIYFSRLNNRVWSPGQRLAADNWRIEGCPVNGPAIDADGRNVAVAWFTGADDMPRVRASWSDDGGRSFSGPLEVAAGRTLGRVDIAMLPDGDAVVSWLTAVDDGLAEIRYRRLSQDGSLGRVWTLDATSSARSAGFPQLAAGGDGLVFAWTRVDDPGGIAVATVSLP